jgi:hypothetical protein
MAGGAAGGMAGGRPDGGSPLDGGCPPRYFTIGSTTWNDLQPLGNDFILVGNGSTITRYRPADGGIANLGGGTCAAQGDFLGVAVRASDQAVFISTDQGELLRWTDVGQCSLVNGFGAGWQATAVRAFDDFLFLGAFQSASIANAGTVSIARFRPDGGLVSSPSLGFGQLWELSGPSSADAFAAGWDHATQRRNRVWNYNTGNGNWDEVVATNTANTPLLAVEVPAPTFGFAAGTAFVEFNGTSWAYRTDPPFEVFGLRAFSPNEVYAVGLDRTRSRVGLALWDGSAWTVFGPSVPPGGYLARVRGADRCNLLGVGSGGNAFTTRP